MVVVVVPRGKRRHAPVDETALRQRAVLERVVGTTLAPGLGPRIGSLLPRKGEGLFGFNYTLRGPSAAPQVSVNPLSLLTPGMFREIFRRPPPRISQAPTQ